ncbi:MAG: endolytic transglycosylase MltG [Candidatus Saccharimonadales bacterium]
MDDDLKQIDSTSLTPMRIRHKRSWWAIIGVIVISIIAVAGLVVTSYFAALSPVDHQASETIRVVIQPGQTASDIADNLFSHGLIRNKQAFQLYTQLSGTNSKLQSGGYVLRRSQSVQDIVQHLVAGKTDELRVTILPGLTLQELADPGVEGSLAQQGFTPDEISAAFAKSYTSPLFKDKPVGTSLEGYLYPETYIIAANDTLDRVLTMTFSEFYGVITKNKLDEQAAARGLNLYQAITLASIVQKEISDPSDQRQVAQVFLKRLSDGMVLGSDVTFMYIAKKEGRVPSVNDPSPYNTRRAGGLPPGPIANFNLSALQAVANPASGDYVYFVAGDDGKTYFARTEAEHEANVAKYCTTLCQ